MTDCDFQEFISQVQTEVDRQPELQMIEEQKEVEQGGDSLVIAQAIYQKIDTEGRGYIDRAMLRSYCQRIIDVVNRNEPFDETSFELGFLALDTDADNRITLQDLIQFTNKNKSCNQQIP